MSHYLAELYTPKAAWLALDQKARGQFFGGIAAGMAGLTALGVEAIALGQTEAATLHAPDQQFMALWRTPDAGAMQALIEGIAASGWHRYFETINATCRGGDLAEHMGQLAAL